MSVSVPCLITIVGPTAVGKTAKAIELAQALNSEIISADSRQFYQEMKIGTAKPSPEELQKVRHHFVDSHSIHDFYSAGDFERDTLALLNGLFKTNSKVIMVGGSGMYVKAVCEGFDEMPEIDTAVREELNKDFLENGLDELLVELRSSDPEFYEVVDKNNHQRVIRALEVIRSTNQPFSSFRNNKPSKSRPFKNVKIGLDLPREELYHRIDHRMDQMIIDGLFEEAEALYEHKTLNALQTVGYKEIFGFMDGEYDKEEAIRLLKRNSRRYAKRQLTWFKADPEIRWFDAKTNVNEILISLQLE